MLVVDLLFSHDFAFLIGTIRPPLPSKSFKPGNYTFLIQERNTNTCLTFYPCRPRFISGYYEFLYNVTLTPCNSSSLDQHWQWTKNDQLLHVGISLCLTVCCEENLLCLRTCNSTLSPQKWNFFNNGSIDSRQDCAYSVVENNGSKNAYYCDVIRRFQPSIALNFYESTPRETQMKECDNLDIDYFSILIKKVSMWITCKDGSYINGFWHTYEKSYRPPLNNGLISGIRCCEADTDSNYTKNSTQSYSFSEECVDIKDFPSIVDKSFQSFGWLSCPQGYYLKGMMIGRRDRSFTTSIRMGRCCKKTSLPKGYQNCYETERPHNTIDTLSYRCPTDDYFLIQVLRYNGCNDSGYFCDEKVICCK